MGTYRCGPSVLRLTGRVGAVIPGDFFEHDFSRTGPEGWDGPAREAALLAAGTITKYPDGQTEFEQIETRAAADRAAVIAGAVELPAPAQVQPPVAPPATEAAHTTDDDHHTE